MVRNQGLSKIPVNGRVLARSPAQIEPGQQVYRKLGFCCHAGSILTQLMSDETKDKIMTARIADNLAGRRLDQALAKMFPQFSRSRIKSWILQGLVTVEGEHLRPKDTVSGGAVVVLEPRAEIAIKSPAQAMVLR